ncbi:MAG TPA: MFS transporter [Clostridiaceae bacterium]|nr:MFS transporter [Clostridiaceae bacterium]
MLKLREKSYYKWIIAFSSLIVMIMTVGIIYNVFTIFTIPVTEGLSISRQTFSLAQTLIFTATIFVNPFISKLVEKTGLIRLIRIFSVATPIFYFGFSFVNSTWQLYLVSLLVGISQCFVSMVPLSILLNSWFDKDIGLALGITFMGSGIGGMIFNPVVNSIIENYSWRHAFGFLSIVMFIFLVPIGLFVIILPPQMSQKEHLTTYQESETAASLNVETRASSAVEENNSYLKDRRFWIISLAFILDGVAGYSIINFVTPYFRDLGYSSYYAANVMAMSMGLMAVGKVVLGFVYDRTNVRFATLLAIFAAFVGLVALYFAQYPWALIFLGFGNFFGSPAGTVSQPLVTKGVFRARDYAKVNGLLVSFSNIGVTLTPIIANTIFDHSGSYRPHFVAMIVLMAICFALFFLVLPRAAKKDSN